MEKRVVFRSAWLPYALVAPQIAITIIFFFWPAAQAVYYSFLVQDPFGNATTFVWFQNFTDLFKDSHYLESFKITALFSVLVAFSGLAISLLLAVMADHVVRGALAYKTLLIWPYAVAPAIAGVLWAFIFAPSIGIATFYLKRFGVDWNWLIQGGPAGATQILVYKVYYDGVKAADLGGSSAQSVILMFIVIALTVAQFRFVEKKVQY